MNLTNMYIVMDNQRIPKVWRYEPYGPDFVSLYNLERTHVLTKGGAEKLKKKLEKGRQRNGITTPNFKVVQLKV